MPKERRELIKNIIMADGRITLARLAEIFGGVSQMTLRRDLELLEKQGHILRTKGGAVSCLSVINENALNKIEANYRDRDMVNAEGKETIARLAAKMIEPGRAIYLDAGTTTMRLARNMEKAKLSIFTSGPNIALELTNKEFDDVSLTGGKINPDNMSLSGMAALEFMETVNIDMAFLAASGYDAQSGYTCGKYDEYTLKKLIVRKAKKVIMLIDSSKLGKSLPYTFAVDEDVDILLCDKQTRD